jgi:hypothetical protein
VVCDNEATVPKKKLRLFYPLSQILWLLFLSTFKDGKVCLRQEKLHVTMLNGSSGSLY